MRLGVVTSLVIVPALAAACHRHHPHPTPPPASGGTAGAPMGGKANGGASGEGGTTNGGASGEGGVGGNAGSDAGAGGNTPDPAGPHCHTHCDDNGCSVEAADEDGDGFGSSECAAAPGPDCDDNNAAIHPGAPEICDGLDDDCDGHADLTPGFALGSDDASVATQQNGANLNMVWAPSPQKFALFANTSAYLITTDGSVAESRPVGLGGSSNDPQTSQNILRAAYRSPFFGVVYNESAADTATSVHGVLITSSFDAGAAFSLDPATVDADVTELPGGDVLVAQVGTTLRLGVLRAQGNSATLDTVGSADETAGSVRVAVNGTTAALVSQSAEGGNVRFRLATLDGIFGPATDLASGFHPAVTVASAGFAVGWFDDGGITVQLRGTDGTLACSAAIDEPHPGSSGDALVLANSAYGTVVLATLEGLDGVRLYRIDDACRVLDTDSREQVAAVGVPGLSIASGRVALAWTDSAQKTHLRVVDERLCQ